MKIIDKLKISDVLSEHPEITWVQNFDAVADIKTKLLYYIMLDNYPTCYLFQYDLVDFKHKAEITEMQDEIQKKMCERVGILYFFTKNGHFESGELIADNIQMIMNKYNWIVTKETFEKIKTFCDNKEIIELLENYGYIV